MYIKTTIKGISYENEITAVISGLVLLGMLSIILLRTMLRKDIVRVLWRVEIEG